LKVLYYIWKIERKKIVNKHFANISFFTLAKEEDFIVEAINCIKMFNKLFELNTARRPNVLSKVNKHTLTG
jgi:hypothetical protein